MRHRISSIAHRQSSITIEVHADKFGDDTTWTLVREYENGALELVLEGGPYLTV